MWLPAEPDLTISGGNAAGYGPALAGYWPCNDGVLGIGYDKSGYARHKTDVGTTIGADIMGYSPVYSGNTGSYSTIPSMGGLAPGSFFTVFFNCLVPTRGVNQSILTMTSSTGVFDFGVFYNASAGKFSAYSENASAADIVVQQSAMPDVLAWLSLAVVLDSVAGANYVRLYLNGLHEQSMQMTGNSTGSVNYSQYHVGKLVQNGASYYPLSGKVKNINMFNVALSASAISKLHSASLASQDELWLVAQSFKSWFAQPPMTWT